MIKMKQGLVDRDGLGFMCIVSSVLIYLIFSKYVDRHGSFSSVKVNNPLHVRIFV